MFLQASPLQTEALRTSPWRPITHVAGTPHRSTKARASQFERLTSGQAPSPSCAYSDALLSPDAHTLRLGPRGRAPCTLLTTRLTPLVGCLSTLTCLQPNLPSLA